MASGAQLQSKVKKLLEKVGSATAPVRYQDVTKAGGNDRLGIHTVTSTAVTDITPTPVVERISSDDILASNGLYQHGDYRLLIAGDFPESKLKSPNGRLLYGSEVLQIQSYQPTGILNGIIVGWDVIARTVKAV